MTAERSQKGRWLRAAGICGVGVLASAAGLHGLADAAPPEKEEAAPVRASASSVSCGRTAPGRGGTPVADADQGSTVVLTRWGKRRVAYVAHEDDRAMHAIDLDLGREVGFTPLDGAPSSVLALPDGRLVVALRDKNRVEVLEPGASPSDALLHRCSVHVAAEPVGMALSPDGSTLAVTSGWGRKLSALDVASMSIRAEVPLPREPRAVVIDDDGQRAFVAHVVDAKLSVVDLPQAASAATTARTVDLGVTKEHRKQMGCQGFALAKSVGAVAKDGERSPLTGRAPPQDPQRAAPKDPTPPERTPEPAAPPPPGREVSGRVFAPMIAADPGDPGSRSGGYGSADRGPAERPIVSVIDAGAERAITRKAAGDALVSQDACLLPRAAVFDAPSQSLLVACLGSDAVVRLDARAVDPSRRELARFRVARGPTGVAIDPELKHAIVFSQFASKLTVVPIGGGSQKEIDVALRASRGPAADVQRGRVLFHATNDKRISEDGRACASCHPDGREDAITWATPEGPRQTIMLAGRLGATAPFGWNGDKKTVKEHVIDTVSRLKGAGFTRPEDTADLDALLAYVTTMPAPTQSSPTPARRELIRRGEELFRDETAACGTCHAAGGSNGQAYQVSGASRAGEAIDTPSLRGVGGTAPYFHDGRFATLEDLLASPDHSMGRTLQLTRKDRLALVAYLEAL